MPWGWGEFPFLGLRGKFDVIGKIGVEVPLAHSHAHATAALGASKDKQNLKHLG